MSTYIKINGHYVDYDGYLVVCGETDLSHGQKINIKGNSIDIGSVTISASNAPFVAPGSSKKVFNIKTTELVGTTSESINLNIYQDSNPSINRTLNINTLTKPHIVTLLEAIVIVGNRILLRGETDVTLGEIIKIKVFVKGTLSETINFVSNGSSFREFTTKSYPYGFINVLIETSNSSFAYRLSIVDVPFTSDIINPTVPDDVEFEDIDGDPEWELDWEDADDVSGIARYEIYADNTLVGRTDVSEFDFNGGLYGYYNSYFTIRTFDIYGNYSVTTPFKLNDDEKPTQITGLNYNNTSGNVFGLSWNQSTDNVRVNAYVIETQNVSNTEDYKYHGETTNTSYILSDLDEFTEYNVRVRAKDYFNNFSDSAIINFRTKDLTKPEVDSVLPNALLVENAGGYLQLKVSFSATDTIPTSGLVSGIDKYTIYVSEPKATVGELGEANTPQLSNETYVASPVTATLLSLESNKWYKVGVSVVDKVGNVSDKKILGNVQIRLL